jgi:hypothetical protein
MLLLLRTYNVQGFRKESNMKARRANNDSIGNALVNLMQTGERFYSFPANRRTYQTIEQSIRRNGLPISVKSMKTCLVIGDTETVKTLPKETAVLKSNTRLLNSALLDLVNILESWEPFHGIESCMGAPETYQRKPKITHLPWKDETYTIGPMKIYGLTAERIAETLEKYGNRARWIPTDSEIDLMTVPGFLPGFDGSCNIDDESSYNGDGVYR